MYDNSRSPVCEKAREHFHQIKTMIEMEVKMKEGNKKENEMSKSRQTERKGNTDSKLKKTRIEIPGLN
jgi:hypothetical protein